jgi:hypothetical protein
MLPFTVEQQWVGRHECHLNDLWRIGHATWTRRIAAETATWQCPLLAQSRHHDPLN